MSAASSPPPDLLTQARAWRAERHSHRAAVSTSPAYRAYLPLASKLLKEKWTVQEIARFLKETVAELKPLKLETIGQGIRRHLKPKPPKTPPAAA